MTEVKLDSHTIALERDGKIFFNEEFLSDDPIIRAKMNAKLDNMVETGWMPKHTTNPRLFIWRHESAHTIWNYIKMNEPELGVKISEILLIAARDGVLAEFSKHSVSENLSEAFADAYASIYAVDPDFQPFFVRLIHKLLKENGMPVKD
jgi:hypothetical protein